MQVGLLRGGPALKAAEDSQQDDRAGCRDNDRSDAVAFDVAKSEHAADEESGDVPPMRIINK